MKLEVIERKMRTISAGCVNYVESFRLGRAYGGAWRVVLSTTQARFKVSRQQDTRSIHKTTQAMYRI